MPVRFFTQAFGGTVAWEQEQRRARLALKDRTLQVRVGEPYGFINGKMVALDQSAVLFMDRVFVPVRFLVEGFTGQVAWDHFNRSVRVQLEGVACINTVYCGEAR